MRERGLTPADITRAEDIARLPLIERDQLQRDPEYFVSEGLPPEERLEVRTGGSTGEPILFWRDPRSLLQRVIGFQRLEPVLAQLTGRRLRRRQALIAPPDSSTSGVNKAVRHRLLPSIRTVHQVFSLFTPPKELAAEIERFEPDMITAYGSAIEALFAILLAREDPGHLPSVVVYAADSLSERMRAEISALGVNVLSVYQAVEMPTIGFECEQHVGHHLNVDLCPLRLVDAEGCTAGSGVRGDVVASNLVSRGTVLLNYRLGDTARSVPGSCACGRSLPLISWIDGRTSEWLRTAAGESVHPQTFRSILRKVPGVLRYQLQQERPGHVRILVVAAPGADADHVRVSVEGESAELADQLAVEVAFTDSLPRTEAGKVRSTVS
jgi:phenylacetate-CoA ligase